MSSKMASVFANDSRKMEDYNIVDNELLRQTQTPPYDISPEEKEKEQNLYKRISEEAEKYGASLPRERTPQEESYRNINITGKVIGGHLLGQTGDFQRMLDTPMNYAIKKLTGREVPKGIDLPTSEEMERKIEEHFPELAPETKGEETGQRALGKIVDYSVGGPEGLLGRLVKAGISVTAAEKVGEKLEEGGFDPKTVAAVKTVLEVGSQLVGGSGVRPTNEQERRLALAAEHLQLTHEELTPLMQSEEKLLRYGRISTPSARVRRSMERVSDATLEAREGLMARGREIPLPQAQVDNLIREGEHLRGRILEGAGRDPEIREAVGILDSTLADLRGRQDLTAASLLETHRTLNRGFRRHAPHVSNELQQFNRFIEHTLNRLGPEGARIAREFRFNNIVHSARMRLAEHVGWTNIEHAAQTGDIHMRAIAATVGGIAGGAAKGSIKGITGAVIGFLGEISFGAAATALLTNPNFQGIRRNMERALRTQSPQLANVAYKQFKEKVKKEMPTEYIKYNWPE